MGWWLEHQMVIELETMKDVRLVALKEILMVDLRVVEWVARTEENWE
jgi:hypothetical protein